MTKILLAEDDLSLARMYQVVLEKNGILVDYAADGEECLTKIKKDKPQLVLLDLVMPNKNGFEVLEELQRARVKIPVICLSVLDSQEDIDRCLKLGASDYLVKTDIGPENIVSKVLSAVKSP